MCQQLQRRRPTLIFASQHQCLPWLPTRTTVTLLSYATLSFLCALHTGITAMFQNGIGSTLPHALAARFTHTLLQMPSCLPADICVPCGNMLHCLQPYQSYKPTSVP